ncbi:uncharacterized protein [Oscarella lobularis]|uniref:uncharacterized protein n=1 Tax=Oscarella lobularis TaxID=121494 RepID=UPI0033141433
MKGSGYFCLFFHFVAFSEPVRRSAIVGESGSSTSLFALRGDRVTLTYTYRIAVQSITFGWFLSFGGNSTSLSAIPNPDRFSARVSNPNATLEFVFDASIPDGSLFRSLVTVTTITNGVPSSSSSFAGSVALKLGAFPKVDSISDVVIAEGEPIINAVSVIEGRPNPIVTLINTTRDQSLMLVALNSAQYQIRKTRASISDGGVYRVEATNAVGKDIINFTVTVHFLRLLDCDLCSATKKSTVNCIFSSSPKPTEVRFNNQLVPVNEAVVFDNYVNYVVSVPISGQPRQLMISNKYSSPILVKCNRPLTTVASALFTTGKRVTEVNEITFQSPSNAEGSCGRNEGYIAAIAVLSALLSATLIGILILWIYVKRGKRKEDPISVKAKEKVKDVEMHPSSLYQDASKLTKATETHAKGSTKAVYASISETK